MSLPVFTLIISLCSLILALYTFIKHDSKIKKQTKLINDLQLEKLNKEKITDKKAIIEGNLFSKNKGVITIRIFNKGKSLAKNVMAKIKDEQNFYVLTNPKSIDLKPHNSFEIRLVCREGSTEILQLNYFWDDDFKNNNLDNQSIQIL